MSITEVFFIIFTYILGTINSFIIFWLFFKKPNITAESDDKPLKR